MRKLPVRAFAGPLRGFLRKNPCEMEITRQRSVCSWDVGRAASLKVASAACNGCGVTGTSHFSNVLETPLGWFCIQICTTTVDRTNSDPGAEIMSSAAARPAGGILSPQHSSCVSFLKIFHLWFFCEWKPPGYIFGLGFGKTSRDLEAGAPVATPRLGSEQGQPPRWGVPFGAHQPPAASCAHLRQGPAVGTPAVVAWSHWFS